MRSGDKAVVPFHTFDRDRLGFAIFKEHQLGQVDHFYGVAVDEQNPTQNRCEVLPSGKPTLRCVVVFVMGGRHYLQQDIPNAKDLSVTR